MIAKIRFGVETIIINPREQKLGYYTEKILDIRRIREFQEPDVYPGTRFIGEVKHRNEIHQIFFHNGFWETRETMFNRLWVNNMNEAWANTPPKETQLELF